MFKSRPGRGSTSHISSFSKIGSYHKSLICFLTRDKIRSPYYLTNRRIYYRSKIYAQKPSHSSIYRSRYYGVYGREVSSSLA